MLVEELFAEEGEKRRVFTVSCKQPNLRLLTERAALGQASLTAGRLREHLGARAADNHGLGVREDGGDSEAARALDVHEERVGVLHKSLELVAASLLLGGGVEKVDGESLRGRSGERGMWLAHLHFRVRLSSIKSRSAARQQSAVGSRSSVSTGAMGKGAKRLAMYRCRFELLMRLQSQCSEGRRVSM